MSESTTLSREIVERLMVLHRGIPDDVMISARLHFLDALGVGAVGARRGPLRGLSQLATGVHAGGRSSVLGSSTATSASVAALVNGSLIHSLEFDDTHVASVIHGSSTLAATALAVAQETGTGGDDMLSAFVIGWELLVRMGLASPGTLQARGFQTTSAAGPFAAALVSSLLHSDDTETAVNALGIAGSQPGGTFAFLTDGDTVKAGQPAWAAHSGIWAAELARAGMTGPERVLEGSLGFYELYADDPGAAGRLRHDLDNIGLCWHLQEAAFKLIPCCHFIHPFVEALSLLLDPGLEAGQIQNIHCLVPRGMAPVIAEPWPDRQHPRSSHDARWSLPYVLAARVVNGHVGLDLFDAPIGGETLGLAERVTFTPWDDSGFPARYPARLTVRTTGGQNLSAEVHDVLGGSGRPIGSDDIIKKALRNLGIAGLDEIQGRAVVRELTDEPSPDLDMLGSLLGKVGTL